MIMLNENNDGSSSSEDEISKAALREATDHQFLKVTYFSNEKFQNSDVSTKTYEHSKYHNLIFVSISRLFLIIIETCNNWQQIFLSSF